MSPSYAGDKVPKIPSKLLSGGQQWPHIERLVQFCGNFVTGAGQMWENCDFCDYCEYRDIAMLKYCGYCEYCDIKMWKYCDYCEYFDTAMWKYCEYCDGGYIVIGARWDLITFKRGAGP